MQLPQMNIGVDKTEGGKRGECMTRIKISKLILTLRQYSSMQLAELLCITFIKNITLHSRIHNLYII